jgi:hypothetical protein
MRLIPLAFTRIKPQNLLLLIIAASIAVRAEAFALTLKTLIGDEKDCIMNHIEKTLRSALARINSSTKWNQGNYAVDTNGNRTMENSPSACKWCMVGALCAEYPGNIVEIADHRVFDLLRDGIKFVSGDGVSLDKFHLWNDAPERTYRDVADAYKHAIAKAHSLGL